MPQCFFFFFLILANFGIVLLNILIALYNSAYEDISGNAIDEYMAIFALKTMQFVRAPDENVFIPRKYKNAILKNPQPNKPPQPSTSSRSFC